TARRPGPAPPPRRRARRSDGASAGPPLRRNVGLSGLAFLERGGSFGRSADSLITRIPNGLEVNGTPPLASARIVRDAGGIVDADRLAPALEIQGASRFRP